MNPIKSIPIDQIKVKERYRVDHGDIEALGVTIKEHGLIQPITVDQYMRLLSGERRYLAHKHIGATHIDAIIRPVNDKIEALEIELIENIFRKDFNWPERARLEARIMEMKLSVDKTWTQMKQSELTGTPQSKVSRRLQLAAALDTLPELEEFETEEEAFKTYKKLEEGMVLNMMKERVPQHVLDAVDRASEHYLIGDAFQGMASLPDKSFHFAEVDPPYGVALDKRKSRNEDQSQMETYQEWEEFEELFHLTASHVYRLLKPHSFAVFWYGMSWHSQVMGILRRVGFSIPDIPAIWYKGDAGQTASPDTTLGSCYEPFFMARKGQPKLAHPGRGNVFHFPMVTKKIHATEKPLLLLKEIMRIICFPGSNILCPFLGSGSTLRAAYRLGHTGIGWDLAQEHKDGFLRRVQDDQKELKVQQEDEEAA